jgi:uncharacterized repeat protein (TIGR01451 family)
MSKTLLIRAPIQIGKLSQVLRWSFLAVLLFLVIQNPGLASTAGRDAGRPGDNVPVVITWHGSTGNRQWSDPANWEGGRIPRSADFVRFPKGSADAIVGPAFGGVIAGLSLEDGFTGTVTLARALCIQGELTLADGVFNQAANALTAQRYTQTGGAFNGGSANMMIDGSATVTAGTLTTPHAVLTVSSLTIEAPGTVIMASDGKLNLAGSGTPLRGNGRLDTTAHRPNSMEYTGRGTTDVTKAGPATAYHDLPLAPQNFGEYATLTLNAGEDDLDSAVIDPASGFAYFGTGTDPGIVVKVRLSDFTRVGALTLNQGEGRFRAAVIDSSAGFAYFGTSFLGQPGKLVKVRLSDFTRAGVLTLNAREDNLRSAVIDPAAGFAYFGTDDNASFPPRQNTVVKIRLSDFTRAGVLILDPNGGGPTSAVIDPMAGFAYFGTSRWPSHVVKVRLSNFTVAGVLTLNADECASPSAAIDSLAGFAYFGTAWCTDGYVPPYPIATAKIVKVRLSDLARIDAINLSGTVGEGGLISAVIDPAAGFAYFGSDIWYGKSGVIKVRLSNFTRSDTLTFNATTLPSAVIDPPAGYAYFGTSGRSVFKADLVPLWSDLSISQTDGRSTVLPGDTITYTIKVVNHGPEVVANAVVQDTFSDALTVVNWQCSASAGSSCAAGGWHSGSISTTVNLGIDGIATFLASGAISSALDVVLSNMAIVTLPPSSDDPNPSNNSALDADWIGAAWPHAVHLPLMFK